MGRSSALITSKGGTLRAFLVALVLVLIVAGVWSWGCGGGDDTSTAEIEQSVREGLAVCERGSAVDVECQDHGESWSCLYSSGKEAGEITVPDGEHPEISVIC